MPLLNFRDVIDKPEWRILAVSPNASAAGSCIISDLRNSEDRHPTLFQLVSTSVLNQYHMKNDGWSLCINPGLTGTFGAGACGVMAPCRGPRGTLADGCSTTKIILSTALPATVGVNQLAGRGDSRGFKIRIMDNVVGGTGKTEERLIVSNSAGTTPTLYLDSALSFTPSLGASYEFLSGRVYMLSAGTMAAGCWKYFDILTNSLSSNLSITNLPASIRTDSVAVCLDETYIPCDAEISTGFFEQCAITDSASTSLTITCPQTMLASELVGLQVRIIQDTTNPTSVGQRRKITASTAGSSVILTIAAWTTIPSAGAICVLENNNDIVLFTSASSTVYCYNQEANTWATDTYTARGAAVATGLMAFQPFGIAKSIYNNDPDKNFRYTTIHTFSGGGATTLSILNLHTNTWENAVAYGSGPTFTTGSSLIYDGVSTIGKGRFAYINKDGTQVFQRYNAFSRQMNEWTYLRYTQSTAVVGSKFGLCSYFDTIDNSSITFPTIIRSSGTEFFDIMAQR